MQTNMGWQALWVSIIRASEYKNLPHFKKSLFEVAKTTETDIRKPQTSHKQSVYFRDIWQAFTRVRRNALFYGTKQAKRRLFLLLEWSCLSHFNRRFCKSKVNGKFAFNVYPLNWREKANVMAAGIPLNFYINTVHTALNTSTVPVILCHSLVQMYTFSHHNNISLIEKEKAVFLACFLKDNIQLLSGQHIHIGIFHSSW